MIYISIHATVQASVFWVWNILPRGFIGLLTKMAKQNMTTFFWPLRSHVLPNCQMFLKHCWFIPENFMSFPTKLKHKNNEAHLGKNLLYAKCEFFAQVRANELEGFSPFHQKWNFMRVCQKVIKIQPTVAEWSVKKTGPNWDVIYLQWYFFIRKSSSWRIGLFFWVRLFFGNVYLTNESKITNISGNSLIVTTHF